MDRCMARLHELQYTVSGGTKVIAGVSLSPGSTRGYLRTSLRCKQETAGIKGSAPRKSPVGKFGLLMDFGLMGLRIVLNASNCGYESGKFDVHKIVSQICSGVAIIPRLQLRRDGQARKSVADKSIASEDDCVKNNENVESSVNLAAEELIAFPSRVDTLLRFRTLQSCLLYRSPKQCCNSQKFSIGFDHLPNKPRASFFPAKQKKIKEACNFVCSPPLQISLETGKFKGHIFHFLDVQSLDSAHHRAKPFSVYAEGACKREAQVKGF